MPDPAPKFVEARMSLNNSLLESMARISLAKRPIFYVAGCNRSLWTNFDVLFAPNGIEHPDFQSQKRKLLNEFDQTHKKVCGNDHAIQIRYIELAANNYTAIESAANALKNSINEATDFREV